METLFAIASRIATPLSLAGVVVMVLFLLYRQLIAGPLSVQLNQSQAFRTINRLLILVFALAIVAVVLGVGSMLLIHFYPPVKRPADLKPVGINIVEPEVNPKTPPNAHKDPAKILASKLVFLDSKQYPKVEVMVRNSGGQIALVKLATFHVNKIFAFEGIGHPLALPSSWTYDVMLPVDKKTPYTVEIPISQTVAPDGADKFTFRLGNNGSPFGDSMGGGPKTYVFEVNIELEYNEDGKTIAFEDMLIASTPAGSVLGRTVEPNDDVTYDENFNKTTVGARNAKKALELSKIKAVRSPWVKEILGDSASN
jgi:hypothetical protein